MNSPRQINQNQFQVGVAFPISLSPMHCMYAHADSISSALSQPKLSGFGVTSLELLPGLVGLGNDLLGLGGIEELLIETEAVEGLVVGGLVPAEPFPDTVLDGIGDVVNVVVLLGERVVDGNGNDLPVQLAVIDHGKDAEGLDLGDSSHLQGLGTDLDNINRIVIAEHLELRVLLVGVLPGLGKAAVVPEDGAVVVAEVALLDVLGNGVVGLLGGDLHLGLGHLGDLDDHVVAAVPLEGDVVPGADGGAVLSLEVEAEGLGGGLAGLLDGDRVEGGGQGTGGEAAGGGEGRRSGGGGGDSEDGGDGRELHGGTDWWQQYQQKK
mmetsp:Transcript_16723/g.48018  ORF Transcript_16723/g.48018 Transcript_16723/m.48018 type:complete len:323 (-) Transcript_16723:7-975(-)